MKPGTEKIVHQHFCLDAWNRQQLLKPKKKEMQRVSARIDGTCETKKMWRSAVKVPERKRCQYKKIKSYVKKTEPVEFLPMRTVSRSLRVCLFVGCFCCRRRCFTEEGSRAAWLSIFCNRAK